MIPQPPYSVLFEDCETYIVDSNNNKVFVDQFQHFGTPLECDNFLESIVEILNDNQ